MSRVHGYEVAPCSHCGCEVELGHENMDDWCDVEYWLYHPGESECPVAQEEPKRFKGFNNAIEAWNKRQMEGKE